jgi:hypothetical protein
MIRRGVHKSVQALEADIRKWIEHWNEDPRPFTWSKTAEEILNSLGQIYGKNFCRTTSYAEGTVNLGTVGNTTSITTQFTPSF